MRSIFSTRLLFTTGSNTGMIVGIVVSVSVIVIAIAFVVGYLCGKRRDHTNVEMTSRPCWSETRDFQGNPAVYVTR